MADGDRTAEARETYERYVSVRDAIHRGDAAWSALAEFFTDDAVYVDPAWGRVEGRPAIDRFLEESMAGLDGWVFPEEWTMVEGDRVVSLWWTQLPGPEGPEGPPGDGGPLQAPGVSILRYAGDGRFDYELDLLNMTEIFEIMRASTWKPNAAMHAPPERPDRNATPPPKR